MYMTLYNMCTQTEFDWSISNNTWLQYAIYYIECLILYVKYAIFLRAILNRRTDLSLILFILYLEGTFPYPMRYYL
jgi:hypothetical protein